MTLTLFGLLLFVLYGLTTCMIGVKMHIYLSTPVTCAFAQKYCLQFFTNLSIVSNNEDFQKLEEAAGGTYNNSWINSQEISCKSLKYEDTVALNAQFFDNPPFCAFVFETRWKKTSCNNKYPFFCYENIILVQENKTWDEALEHCRSLYTDLATFPFDWPENQIQSETNFTQTNSMWIGLRFLSGNWYWLNVLNVQTDLSLPSCPAEPYRCGARNTRMEQWENRDCEEKLNFLCVQR